MKKRKHSAQWHERKVAQREREMFAKDCRVKTLSVSHAYSEIELYGLRRGNYGASERRSSWAWRKAQEG